MARKRVGDAFSTLPFDGIDNVASIIIHDDFLGAGDDADFASASVVQTAQATWVGVEVAGGDEAGGTFVAGVADHPGIYRLVTANGTAATGDAVALCLGAVTDPGVDGDIVLDDNGVYLAAVVRINDVDATKAEFGLIGQAPALPNAGASDIVSWVWDPADSANVGDALWIAQVNSGGQDAETACSVVSYVEGDWVLLEIAATDTSAIFKITTEDGSEVIEILESDIPTSGAFPTVALTPAFGASAIGAAVENLDIDAFHLRYMRKDALVGVQNDWLGA